MKALSSLPCRKASGTVSLAMKWLVCVPETPLYGSMDLSALPPGGERSAHQEQALLPQGHSSSVAGTTTVALLISLVKITVDLLTVHCSSRAFLQRGSCSGRKQQGKSWLNNVALTTHAHQQSMLSPCCSS